MLKLTVIAAAASGLLVPALVVSVAAAAPPAKKKTTKPAAAATAATAPAAPPPVLFETKPKNSALSRVEDSVAGWAPRGPATPTITPWRGDGAAAAPTNEIAGATTLSSAEMGAPPRDREPDASLSSIARARKDPLGAGLSAAPVADVATSKAYGFGVGARLGYTFGSRIYFGGTFVYRAGESNGPLTYAMIYYGPELGYSIPAGPLVVRPYVGGGYGALRTTYHGAGLLPGGGGAGVGDEFTGKSQTPFFWPGVTAFLPMTDALAVGADARVVLAPGQDSSSGVLSNNGSLKFPSTGGASSTALVAGLTGSYRF